MPLTNDRPIKRRDGVQYNDPVAADTVIYTGALACLDASGNAVPGATATDLTARGVCEERADNTGGAAGDISAPIRAGVFNFKNSAGADEITRANIGSDAFIVDDETVALTDGTSTRSVAGEIVGLDDAGVWVRVGV